MSNLDAVRRIYDAFGRADVPGVLAELSEDVEWEYGAGSTDTPWLRPLHGRQMVPAFFRQLFTNTEIEHFAVKDLLEKGDLVLAVVDMRFRVIRTRKVVDEEDEVHVWRFREGKVVRFRHRADTHLQHEAWHGD